MWGNDIVKIVGTLIAGISCGVVLRVLIPVRWGIFLMRKHVGHVFAVNRLAFWACLLGGIALCLIQLAKVLARDLGLSQFFAS